jgi:hypothetical protein
MPVSKSAPPAVASLVHTGDGGLRSFAGSAEGGLPAPEATTLAPVEDLLGPKAVGFAAGGGSASRGSGLRASPRPLCLADRVPDPCERPALLRRILTIFVHHCRYNNSNIPSIRKNLHLTGQTRRKYVLAGHPGNWNVTWPSTPGNFQHSRRRLPELGRRHPSPEGRTSTHQLHGKAIRDPQPPNGSTYFYLLSGQGSLLRRAFLSHGHWLFPAAVNSHSSVVFRVTTVWKTV